MIGRQRWRLLALILAVLAFGLAAGGAEPWLLGGFSLPGGRMAFFWAGVVCFLVAIWGRGGT